MNVRELIILLLGIAIVAIMLRGLYVAMRARRNQLRLAIDRNIPDDLDPDSVALAELPSGGARVLRRGLESVVNQNSLIDLADERVSAIELETDVEKEQIPVLMDAVELPQPDLYAVAAEPLEEEVEPAEEEPEPTEPSLAEFDEEDPDDVLLDYGEDSVQQQSHELWSEDQAEALAQAWAEPAQSALADALAETETAPAAPNSESAVQADWELELADEGGGAPAQPSAVTSELDLNGFSMTAGERIGYEHVGPQEPAAAPNQRALESGALDEYYGGDAKPDIPDAEALEPVAERPSNEESRSAFEPSEVVVLNVMSRSGSSFAGDDLQRALITSGLLFGEMNIFHQRLDNDSKGQIIFSVANILNPGSFDLATMAELRTPGVSLFLALPTPINNLDAFNSMLDIAQQLRGALDGELKDDNRNVMTAQTIEHYRQRIRDFELRRLKAGANRS